MSKDRLSAIKSDPVEFRPSYSRKLGPVGEVAVHCASFGLVAATKQDGDAVGVAIIPGQPGCPCGCKAPGNAFEYRPSTEHARLMAQMLIDAADEVDRVANDKATSLLDRVRKAAGR